MRDNRYCYAAGVATAMLAVILSGCGQKSARYISEPPESTPGWNTYDYATATELESVAPTEADTEPSSEDAADTEPVHSIAYDSKDFPGLASGGGRLV